MEHDLLRPDWQQINVFEKGLHFWMGEAKRIKASSHPKKHQLVANIQFLLSTSNLISDEAFVDVI